MRHLLPAPSAWRLACLLLIRFLGIVLLEMRHFLCRSLPYPCIERFVPQRHHNSLKNGRSHAEVVPRRRNRLQNGRSHAKNFRLFAPLCLCLLVVLRRLNYLQIVRSSDKVFGASFRLSANAFWWFTGAWNVKIG